MAKEHNTTQSGDSVGQVAKYPSRSSRRKVEQSRDVNTINEQLKHPTENDDPSAYLHVGVISKSHYVKTAVLVSLAAVASMLVGLGLFLHAPGGFSTGNNALSLVKVSGELGTQPVLQLEQPVGYAPYATRTLISGNGVKVRENGPVYVRVSVYSADTGVNLTPEGRPVARYGMATKELLGEDLLATVVGQREGSRLLLVRPVKQAGIVSTEMEVDVVDVMPTQLSNTIALPEGFPVSLSFSKKGPKFEGLTGSLESVQIPYFVQLINGSGEALYDDKDSAPAGDKSGSKSKKQPESKTNKWKLPVVQYAVWDLSTGQNKTDTWSSTGPELINPQYFYESLLEEMQAVKVGSRILAIVPGGGEENNHPMLLVMDILGTQTPILD